MLGQEPARPLFLLSKLSKGATATFGRISFWSRRARGQTDRETLDGGGIPGRPPQRKHGAGPENAASEAVGRLPSS